MDFWARGPVWAMKLNDHDFTGNENLKEWAQWSVRGGPRKESARVLAGCFSLESWMGEVGDVINLRNAVTQSL